MSVWSDVRRKQDDLDSDGNAGAGTSVLAQPQGPAFKSLLSSGEGFACCPGPVWVFFVSPASFYEVVAEPAPVAAALT